MILPSYCNQLINASSTLMGIPTPIVEVRVIFFIYLPFDVGGFAEIRAFNNALKFSLLLLFSSKLQ